MKNFLITEEEAKKLGIKTDSLTRIWQWYGEIELESDIDSEYVKIDGKTKEELMEMAMETPIIINTSDKVWDGLAKDMEEQLKSEKTE
ncbi:hypothetical protein [Cetobacterium sp.]|uniref:hypothetical protein n=1 Tax=Cetobacterium sp. TaxID=2071632 RepID=UPI003F408D63